MYIDISVESRISCLFLKKQFISREMEAGTPGTRETDLCETFGGTVYAVLLQPRSNFQLSNVPESPDLYFSLQMIVVDSRAVFPH